MINQPSEARLPAISVTTDMNASRQNTDRNQRDGCQYALRRGLGTWEVTYEGGRDSFSDEQGAAYVVWLLLHPPPQPIHPLALALEARHAPGYTPSAADVIQERNLGLDDAEAVRNLRRQARKLEAVLEDKLASEPEKAEARQQREQILEFLRKSSWRTQTSAQKCVRAVTKAIKRLHRRLEVAEDAEDKPHPVLQAFARHIEEHLLIPSGRAGGHGGRRVRRAANGCFNYVPPKGVVWRLQS
jgi:hypothetical protein